MVINLFPRPWLLARSDSKQFCVTKIFDTFCLLLSPMTYVCMHVWVYKNQCGRSTVLVVVVRARMSLKSNLKLVGSTGNHHRQQ